MQRFIKHWQLWVLFLLIVVGAWLRLTDLGKVPPGLTTDEAAITYDAWGISIDGKDQWNQSWPLIFTSLGDGKLPLIHYVLALFFRVVGFSLYGIRYLAAGSGVLLIVGTFLLGERLFKETPFIGLMAAILVCFSPWTIHFSRFGLEAGLAVTLAVFGLYGLTKRSFWGIGLLAASVYTYHSSLLVIPLVLITYLLSQRTFTRTYRVVSVCFFLVLIIPLLVAESRSGWTRANQAVIMPNSIREIGTRLSAQISPSFWIWGKQPNLRQAIPGSFVLLLPELLVLGIGIWQSRRLNHATQLFISIWFCIGLVPSLIGTPSPHTIRAFHLVPVIFYIEAFGWRWLLQQEYRLFSIVVVGYVIFWTMFWSTYTTTYVSQAASDYGYGYAEVFALLQKYKRQTTTFVVSPFLDQPYIYCIVLENFSSRISVWRTREYDISTNQMARTSNKYFVCR